MPAYPVAYAAAFFTPAPTNASILAALADGVAGTFLNYTGQAGPCYELESSSPPGLGETGWAYQTCTEVVQSLGQYGPPTDMFYPAPYDFAASVAYCQATFNGTTPRANAGLFQYGGAEALRSVTNVVFSQGSLDPWSLLGPTANVTSNPSMTVVVIEGGAHHLDLRAANPADPPAVVEARRIELAAIRRWINEWNEARGLPGRV